MKQVLKTAVSVLVIAYIIAVIFAAVIPISVQQALQGHQPSAVLLSDEQYASSHFISRIKDRLVFEEYQPRTYLGLITVTRLTWQAEYNLTTGAVEGALTGFQDEPPEESSVLFYAQRYTQVLPYGDCYFIFGLAKENNFSIPSNCWDIQCIPLEDGLVVFSCYSYHDIV